MSPLWNAARAASRSTSTWSAPAHVSASGTPRHTSRARSRWRRASAGAKAAIAWRPARTEADSARGRSWAAYQWTARVAGHGRVVAGQARVPLERLGVGGVQLRALAGKQVLVDGVAGERVPERVAAPGAVDDQQ